jgi:hypothetical protein
MKGSFDKDPNDRRNRTWYCTKDAYAFLVDAPITLGHSQLIVIGKTSNYEEDSFKRASVHIVRCIKRLRSILCTLNLNKWNALARYTGTSGQYKKTLVLKASAKENEHEYKIHLVPYFSSHFDSTNRLHAATQEINSSDPGGLLHWVGERERLVDYDMRDGRENTIIKKRITSFNIPELALELMKRKIT